MRILIFALAVAACGGHGQGFGECEGDACCVIDSQCSDEDGFARFCLAPGASPGCGFCPESECFDDSACATQTGTICDRSRCGDFCDSGECVPGCATTGCDDGAVCDVATNHCVAAPCAGDGDCPVDFECVPGGTCARRSCEDGSDCDGFCVGARCHQVAGSCVIPPV